MLDKIDWVAILSNSHVIVALTTMVVTMAFRNLLGDLIALLFNSAMSVTLWRNLTAEQIAKREIVTLPAKVERMAQNHTECLVQNATLIGKVDNLEVQLSTLMIRLGIEINDKQ